MYPVAFRDHSYLPLSHQDFYNPHRMYGFTWSWLSLPLLPVSRWELVGCWAAKFLSAVVIVESTVVPISWLSEQCTVPTGKFSQLNFR